MNTLNSDRRRTYRARDNNTEKEAAKPQKLRHHYSASCVLLRYNDLLSLDSVLIQRVEQ